LRDPHSAGRSKKIGAAAGAAPGDVFLIGIELFQKSARKDKTILAAMSFNLGAGQSRFCWASRPL